VRLGGGVEGAQGDGHEPRSTSPAPAASEQHPQSPHLCAARPPCLLGAGAGPVDPVDAWAAPNPWPFIKAKPSSTHSPRNAQPFTPNPPSPPCRADCGPGERLDPPRRRGRLPAPLTRSPFINAEPPALHPSCADHGPLAGSWTSRKTAPGPRPLAFTPRAPRRADRGPGERLDRPRRRGRLPAGEQQRRAPPGGLLDLPQGQDGAGQRSY
jgi:hypothetical protein